MQRLCSVRPREPGIDEPGSGKQVKDRLYLPFVLPVASYSLLGLFNGDRRNQIFMETLHVESHVCRVPMGGLWQITHAQFEEVETLQPHSSQPLLCIRGNLRIFEKLGHPWEVSWWRQDGNRADPLHKGGASLVLFTG